MLYRLLGEINHQAESNQPTNDDRDLQHGSSLFRQSQIVNPASIVRLSAPLALGDLMPKIGQRDVGAKLRDQILLAVLPFAPSTDV